MGFMEEYDRLKSRREHTKKMLSKRKKNYIEEYEALKKKSNSSSSLGQESKKTTSPVSYAMTVSERKNRLDDKLLTNHTKEKSVSDYNTFDFNNLSKEIDTLSADYKKRETEKNNLETKIANMQMMVAPESEIEKEKKKLKNYSDLDEQKKELDTKKNKYEYGTKQQTLKHLSGVVNNKDFKKYVEKGVIDYNSDFEDWYDQMTDKERKIYRYYIGKGDKKSAEKYRDALQETLNYRKAQDKFEDIEGNTALEILYGGKLGLQQFGQGMKNLGNMIIGNDEDVSKVATSEQMLAGMISEDLEDNSIPMWYNFKEGKWEDKILNRSTAQLGFDTLNTGANMVPSILASLGVSAVATPAAGAAVGATLMGGSAAGNAYQNGLAEGMEEDEARAYGITIGALEGSLQYALGGIGSLSGTSTKLAKVASGIDKAALRFSLEYGGKISSEALEEGMQEVLDPLVKNAVDSDADENVDWEEVAYSALMGAFMGGTMGGNVNTNTNTNIFTENEQKVIDKEIANRIEEAEKDGKTISKKEKSKIQDDVLRDLERGYISTDTIESVLGNETYNTYKSMEEQENSLREEIEALENTPENQFTVKQRERLTELREQLNNLDKTSVKEKLSSEVSALAKVDRLSESYNEKARRSQAFEADLTKYDAKQQEVIQKAIDSKILNNTNRTHEFVDMVAKISADKGVLFDFTNNQKLKESGFAVEGKTVNGYVKDGNIAVNIDSNKSLNSVVGHEITHILEGTELYSELQNVVKEYATTKGEYDTRFNELSELYKGVEGADIESEITADLIGDYLFTDADFVNNLSVKNPNIFKKIYNEIKYLYKVATAGSKEARQLEKVKRAFEKAYKQSSRVNNDIKYSLEKTSDGTEYVKSEKGKYIKEDGTLVEEKEIFNSLINRVFNLSDGEVKIVNRLPDKSMYAELFKRRPNYKNVDDIKQLNSDINYNMEELIDNSKLKSPNIPDIDGKHSKQGIKSFDTRTVDFYDGSKAYTVDFSIAELNNGEKIVYAKKKAKYNEELTKKIQTSEAMGEKSQLNQKPVFDDKLSQKQSDVKEKISLTEDNKGRKLTKEQQNFLKDSKVVDADGNIKTMYHGSSEEFNVFDIKKAKSSGHYGRGFYFSDSESHAGQYGSAYEVYLNITNPVQAGTRNITKEQLRKFVEVVAENEDYGIENYGYGATVDSVTDSVYGKDDFGILVDINTTAIGDMVEAVKLFNEVNGTNYDGIIADTETVAFYPNQIKKVDNVKPTEDADIRYSLSENNEEMIKNMNVIAEMDSVYDVPIEKLEKTGKKPSELYLEYFNSIGNEIVSDKYGVIKLNKSSVKSEIRHGITAEKLASIEAIPSVIENGEVIFNRRKEGSAVRRIVISAPINIGEVPYYMGVMLQKDSKHQRLYLHNVVIQKETDSSTVDWLTDQNFEENSRLFITNILQKALAVKFDKNSSSKKTDNDYSLSKEGKDIAPVGNYNVYGKDIALQQDIAPVKENIPKTNTFTDNYAPLTEAEANERDAQDRDRLYSLDETDMPEEIEAPYSEPMTPDDPFADRNIEDMGDRKIKAYMYENPEVKPFFQQEAEYMLGELNNSIKGEKSYNDQLYYESGGESGWFGTKRDTSDEIAYLLDNFKYTYADIEKGLKAIIEDNGKENNAISKRIEFMLDERLRLGYSDFISGEQIPANQDYINLLNEKQITDYSDEAWNNWLKSFADENIAPVTEPVTEDIAPIKETISEPTPADKGIALETVEETWDERKDYLKDVIRLDKEIMSLEKKLKDKDFLYELTSYEIDDLQELLSNYKEDRDRLYKEYMQHKSEKGTSQISPKQALNEDTDTSSEDIAPIKEYEAIKPRPDKLSAVEEQWANNKMARADKVKGEEKTAEILDVEPSVEKKKNRAWMMLRNNLLDKQSVFEDLALKTKNRELMGKANSMLSSEAKAQYMIENGREGIKSLNAIRKEVESTGKTKEFYEYLYHKHNADRMRLEERYEDMKNKPVFGDNVTAIVSEDAIKQYEAKYPQFKSLAQDVYNYNEYLRSLLVENSVISEETADLWQEMYPHYVPIRRLGDTGLAVNVPLDTGRTGVNAPIKKAVGGNRDILPLFDTMALRTSQTFKAIDKNSFGVELKNTLGTTIDSNTSNLDEVIDDIDNHEELLKKGENGKNPTFTVFENGEKVTFEITDDMYDALKPTGKGLAYTNGILNKVNNVHRGLLTEYNPVFTLTNAIKDAQDIVINSQHPLNTYKNLPKAYVELAKKGRWYTEYMENGGDYSTYFDKQTNTFVKDMSKFEKVAGMPFRKISDVNNFIEKAPRLAEYIASREKGASVKVAMLDASRVTTNFAAGGDITKLLNRNGFTFLNASVQGAMQQVRNVREAKSNGLKGWVNLATKFAIAGLPTILLNNLLWDDDEEYDELSDYVKQNYYVVGKYGDGKFIRIPKGRTLAVIQEAIQQISNATTGNDEADLKSFLDLAVSNLAPNNPLENNILAPIKQVAENKTWYGEDLVPSRLADLPAKEQFDESTDSISKWLGEKLDIAPVKINYLLDQYSGGVGDVLLPMRTPEAESGDNSLVGNIIAPLKGKFTTDSVLNNQNVSDFYDTSDKLTTNAKKSDATDTDVLKNKYFNSVKGEMAELYGKKREIQNSGLSDEDKYNQVRNIQSQIDDLSKKALGEYEDVNIDNGYATVGDRQFRLTDDGEWTKINDKQLEKQDKVTSYLDIKPSEYWSNKEEYDYAYEYPEKYNFLKENNMSYKDYTNADEDTKDAYTWAYNNPEKFTVSKAVADDVVTYRSYTKDLSKIRADKDENGKTINGSKKEKVLDYINSLDADYGAKLILFRLIYDADDTYNYEIIDYLNSREDITYDEMNTILTELGFRVDSKGNISWD